MLRWCTASPSLSHSPPNTIRSTTTPLVSEPATHQTEIGKSQRPHTTHREEKPCPPDGMQWSEQWKEKANSLEESNGCILDQEDRLERGVKKAIHAKEEKPSLSRGGAYNTMWQMWQKPLTPCHKRVFDDCNNTRYRSLSDEAQDLLSLHHYTKTSQPYSW